MISIFAAIKSFGIKILLGLLVLSFGVWGIGDQLNFGSAQTHVAKIGDIEISAGYFTEQVRRQVRRLNNLTGGQIGGPGGITRDQARALGIPNSVLDSLVQRQIFNVAATRLGLYVDDDLISSEIRSDDRFKGPTGAFDKIKFDQIIYNASMSEGSYIQQMRQIMLQSQYLSGLDLTGAVPRELLNKIYRYRHERRIIEVVRLANDKATGIAQPSGADLAAYHAANKADFTAPEYRTLTLVEMKAADITDEVAISEEQIQEDYNDRIDEYKTPERRTIQHIVVQEEAKVREIHSKLSGGGDFAKVAKELANIEGDVLELGALTKRALPIAEIADAAFQLAENSISQPIKSDLGWHIVRVSGIEPAKTTPLSEVRSKIKNRLALEKATDSLYSLANKFEDELGGGASIDEAAGRLNFKVIKIQAVSAAGRNPAGTQVMQTSRRVLEVAFITAKGTDSQLIDIDTQGYFILRVDNVIDPALRPLDKVTDKVAAAWKAEKQAEASEKQAEALLEKTKKGVKLTQIAKDTNTDLFTSKAFSRTGDGLNFNLPRDMIAVLFKNNVGEAVLSTDGVAQYIAAVTEIKAAAPTIDQKLEKQLAIRLSQNLSDDLQVQFANALRSKIDVTINEAGVREAY